MALIRSTFIFIVLHILVVGSTEFNSIQQDVMCSTKTLHTYGGTVQVHSKKEFQVKCDNGFMAPLSTPKQSHVYKCGNGVLDKRIPMACVETRFAYRKVRFQVLLANSTLAHDLCLSQTKHINLSQCYNETMVTYFPKHPHKLYIVNCSVPKYPGDTIIYATFNNMCSSIKCVHAVITHLHKTNVTSDVSRGGRAEVVLKAFQLLGICCVKLGYLTQDETMRETLLYNFNESISGYHCDDHLVLRSDGDERVCVGCGKGFWMDITNKTCHPCGPGFYSPVETAVECLTCPVQYSFGLWSARSIDDCFQTRRDKLIGVSMLLEAVIVPVTYLMILLLIVTVLHKKRPVRPQDRKTSRLDSSTRFSNVFQSQ